MNKKIGLKTGTCPHCASTEIYFSGKLERSKIAITFLTSFLVDMYLCLNCGKSEEYMIEKDLQDQKLIDKIKKEWKKI